MIEQGYCFSPGVLLTIDESGSIISLIVCVSVYRIWIHPFLNGEEGVWEIGLYAVFAKIGLAANRVQAFGNQSGLALALIRHSHRDA